MNVIEMEIDKVIPYENNPRKGVKADGIKRTD